MAIKIINTSFPNDGLGDPLRDAFNDTNDNITYLDENKVDIETGKALSDRNYTQVEKEKLAGIPADANKNVQADWNQANNLADDFIKNKPDFEQYVSALGTVYLEDEGTKTSPLTVVANVPKFITNDGLGSKTDQSQKPWGVGDIWNDDSQYLDLSDLSIGDTVQVSFYPEFTTTVPNQEVWIEVKSAIGTPSVEIERIVKIIPTVGVHKVHFLYSLSVKNIDFKTGASEFYAGSNAAATFKTGIFFFEIIRKNINVTTIEINQNNIVSNKVAIEINVLSDNSSSFVDLINEYLSNKTITVTETEIPLLEFRIIYDGKILADRTIKALYLWASGKGTFVNPNLSDNFRFVYKGNIIPSDVLDDGNTVVYDLGTLLPGADFVYEINNSIAPFDFTLETNVYLVKFIQNEISNMFYFDGFPGTYGYGLLQSTESDYIEVNDNKGYIVDAEIDGNTWARKDGAWVIVPTGGGGDAYLTIDRTVAGGTISTSQDDNNKLTILQGVTEYLIVLTGAVEIPNGHKQYFELGANVVANVTTDSFCEIENSDDFSLVQGYTYSLTKTAVDKWIVSSVAMPGITENSEDVNNKQNSLAADGTGKKYSSTDAVNLGLSSIVKTLGNTGVTDAADSVELTALNSTTLRILPLSLGLFIKEVTTNNLTAFKSFAQTDYPLAQLITATGNNENVNPIITDGRYYRYIGYKVNGGIITSNSSFNSNDSVLGLGAIAVIKTGASVVFIDVTLTSLRNCNTFPKFATNSKLLLTKAAISSNCTIIKRADTGFGHTDFAITGPSINWHQGTRNPANGADINSLAILGSALVQWLELSPRTNNLITTLNQYTYMTESFDDGFGGGAIAFNNSYFDTTLNRRNTLAAGVATVKRILVSNTGRLWIQEGEFTTASGGGFIATGSGSTAISALTNAQNQSGSVVFSNSGFPSESFTEVGRMCFVKQFTSGTDTTQFSFIQTNGAGGGSSTASTTTPDATETVKGILQFATDAEIVAGSSRSLGVNPAALKVAGDKKQDINKTLFVGANSTADNTWNGATIFFTASCTITIPLGLISGFVFNGITKAGVTIAFVTTAVTTPWGAFPNAEEKSIFTLQNELSTNNFYLLGL